MKYDVDYYITKFEAISEENIITNDFDLGSKKCALGWCGYDGIGRWDTIGEASELILLVKMYLGLTITVINDGTNSAYMQPTAKQRVLAALYDIKTMQAVKEANETINQEKLQSCNTY